MLAGRNDDFGEGKCELSFSRHEARVFEEIESRRESKAPQTDLRSFSAHTIRRSLVEKAHHA